jgi:hypothetical protein
MNIGALNAYQLPDKIYYDVYWKQMSDRKIPHIQDNIVPTTKGRHHSYTWHRPCCQSPGGKGVDMKHGSYDRYLNKIKGKQPLRRGIIPPITPTIIFNRADPIYGGKTFKTNIVSGYNCPICKNENGDENIYIAGVAVCANPYAVTTLQARNLNWNNNGSFIKNVNTNVWESRGINWTSDNWQDEPLALINDVIVPPEF